MGLWVEVERSTFKRFNELHDIDGSDEPRASERIANQPPGYENLLGHEVEIQFGTRENRRSGFLQNRHIAWQRSSAPDSTAGDTGQSYGAPGLSLTESSIASRRPGPGLFQCLILDSQP